MESFTVQEALGQLQKLISETSKDHRHFRITSKEGNVVLIPEDTYNNLQITLEILSVPGLMKCLQDGNSEDEVDPFACEEG